MDNSINCKYLFTLDTFLFRYIFDGLNYPWEILTALKSTIETIISHGIKGYTFFDNGVLVGKNVSIADSARIEAPTIISDGCEIRHCAYIRGSVILGKGCVVGNSTEIKNSILMNGVQAPHYNYVGDSILGNGAHLGAGAICSNLRSDKKNVVIKGGSFSIDTKQRKLGAILGDSVDIGCGAVLCPGTVIGKHSMVYPLTLVRGVHPENQIIKSGKAVLRE